MCSSSIGPERAEGLNQSFSGQLATGATIPEQAARSVPDLEEVFGALSLLLNGGGVPRTPSVILLAGCQDEPMLYRRVESAARQILGGGRNGIYVIDIDGANDRQITSSGFHSAWSPDGQRLAISDFDPQAAFAFAIYLTDNNGNNRIKLTNNGRTDSAAPAWQRIGGPPAPPPPPPTVYSVTGQVVDSGPFFVGAGVPGITVSLSGSVSAVTTTDADGKFRFAGLPQSGTFTLTPSTSNWGLRRIKHSLHHLLVRDSQVETLM